MGYLSYDEMKSLGFKHLGDKVKISDKASIYDCDRIEINDNSRIDDFCVISGRITIGSFVHIAPFCLVAGGSEGVFIDDFVSLAYGVKIFSQSDDYSGKTMTNPNIPSTYKNEFKKAVHIGRHCIIGAGSVILPGVNVQEGTSIGAMSLIRKTTIPWSIYVGNPAKRIIQRKKDLLKLEEQFLLEKNKSK